MDDVWWCCDVFVHQASVSCEWLINDDSILVTLSVSRSCALELLEQMQTCFLVVSHTSKQGQNLNIKSPTDPHKPSCAHAAVQVLLGTLT